MPNRLPTKCSYPLCFNIGDYHETGGRCPQHQQQSEHDRRQAHDMAYLRGPCWDRFKKMFDGLGNTICQRVGPCPGERERDVRCRNAMYYHHHLLDPNAHPTVAFDWRNVVAACRSCHPRPTDTDQGRWVPTMWRTPMSDEPLPVMVAMPGQKVPSSLVLWTPANRLAELVSR